MRKAYTFAPLLLLPLLALSACTSVGEVSPTIPPNPSTKPSNSAPAPTASSGQVLGSVTASTNEGEATAFTLPASGYKVQVLCEGDATAKLRVSVRTEARKIDASHTVDSTTNSADISCLSNKPYVLMASEILGKAAGTGALLRLEVLSGTVSHASATIVAD